MEAIDESFSHSRMITISTEVNAENAIIRISDSGCGMSNDVLKNLFIPFYSTKEKGTGIGLSMCKKIIEENGGSIYVESMIQKGTTFTIMFPLQTFAHQVKSLSERNL
ncbi:ATP-binding protein [Neobacillus sp. SM06]|uniref:ATP-binding protein n=1 Tax=Neobacillus sp. SM06 TaxID=3422492 RepID=UPI003D2A3DE7